MITIIIMMNLTLILFFFKAIFGEFCIEFYGIASVAFAQLRCYIVYVVRLREEKIDILTRHKYKRLNSFLFDDTLISLILLI